jgi:hypothetical protein
VAYRRVWSGTIGEKQGGHIDDPDDHHERLMPEKVSCRLMAARRLPPILPCELGPLVISHP